MRQLPCCVVVKVVIMIMIGPRPTLSIGHYFFLPSLLLSCVVKRMLKRLQAISVHEDVDHCEYIISEAAKLSLV